MYRSSVATTLLSILLAAPASAQETADPRPEALDGVDVVVLLREGKEVFGTSAHRATDGTFDYLFSSAETRAEFERAPERYGIQAGGLCARMGGLRTANPSNYVVHDSRIYIFASDSCRETFVRTPAKFIAKDRAPMPDSAAAAEQGRTWLDKAADAHGGAALDKASTYVESFSTVTQGQSGDVRVASKNAWRFPDRVRLDRTMTMGDAPRTSATLLTPEGTWGISPSGSAVRVPSAGVETLEQLLGRQLIPLLRRRGAEGTRIAALEAATIDGRQLDRVRVQRGGLDVTLHLDPATGRVHSAAWVGRNDQGEIGDVVMTYSDYRPVDGVLVPFREEATFEGAPAPALGRTLEQALVNAPLDASLFAPPADPGR